MAAELKDLYAPASTFWILAPLAEDKLILECGFADGEKRQERTSARVAGKTSAWGHVALSAH